MFLSHVLKKYQRYLRGKLMNVNSINFGKTYKIVGDNQKVVANRMVNLINCYVSPNTPQESKIQGTLIDTFDDATILVPSRMVALNQGRDIFVVSGEEASEIEDLELDRDYHINCVCKNYPHNKSIQEAAKDSEYDRFEAIAGEILENSQAGTIQGQYSSKKNALKSIDIQA